MATKVVVKQEEPEIPVEILAASIVKISDGFDRLMKGPLKTDALVLLIQHAMPSVNRTQIKKVLEALPDLKHLYLKPEYLKRKG